MYDFKKKMDTLDLSAKMSYRNFAIHFFDNFYIELFILNPYLDIKSKAQTQNLYNHKKSYTVFDHAHNASLRLAIVADNTASDIKEVFD